MADSGRRERGPFAGALTLGRPGGVVVRAHWSVLVITALIAWALGAQALPAIAPASGPLAHALGGAVAAVLFVLCLLAHELSHAVVARRNGIPVESITLWLLGGVARLGGEAPDPGADMRVAGIGPLVSLLLGAAAGVLALGAVAVGAPDVLVGVLGWLAAVNVLLAVFNVLPGAPLDGGRLLRAALWAWRGDRVWAAVTAARAGRVLGIVLAVVGLTQFLATGSLAALWLVMIGWFVIGAATREEQATRLGESLAGVRIRDVMTPRPVTVPAGLSVGQFVEDFLLGSRCSGFPVVEDDRPVGLVTLDQVRAVPAAERWSTPLTLVATPLADVPRAAPGELLSEILPRLAGGTGGRVLVFEEEHLVGIVTPSDISRAVQRAALRDTAVRSGRASRRPATPRTPEDLPRQDLATQDLPTQDQGHLRAGTGLRNRGTVRPTPLEEP